MSVIDTIVKEKKHVKRSDGYHPVSQWTSSDTVEMPNGKTLSENIVELTQAEYDALDDSKLTDDVNYLITDGEGGGGGSSVVIDTTLTVNGAAADAKTVGDRLATVNNSNVYYDIETDGDYRKDENGKWVLIGSVGLKELPLYVNGNQGNFVGYMGGVSPDTGDSIPSLTIGESLVITATGYAGSAISDKYDLTRFSKLKFHHTSTTGSHSYNSASVFITDTKQSKIIPVTSKELVSGANKTVNGDVELDITNLNGEYYIGFYSRNNGGGVTVTVSNIKLS